MRRLATGFSMIELLVAVLVMAIGVLGVAALQMVSLQNNRAALVRAEAVTLAYDMMDRIRANPVGTPPGDDYDGLAMGAIPPDSPNCLTTNCTAAQMVAFDQRSWKCQLGAHNEHDRCTAFRTAGVLPPVANQPGLPNGDGSIAVDDDGIVEITVRWTDQGGEVQTVVIDSQT
ncbi:MAG: type IV pilus modification protein PilV [Pseudomonadales bacterium]|nr:type IV pilus modification protein PilV [Pseudomonadales bacterium]